MSTRPRMLTQSEVVRLPTRWGKYGRAFLSDHSEGESGCKISRTSAPPKGVQTPVWRPHASILVRLSSARKKRWLGRALRGPAKPYFLRLIYTSAGLWAQHLAVCNDRIRNTSASLDSSGHVGLIGQHPRGIPHRRERRLSGAGQADCVNQLGASITSRA
jgi:hypothetical protein